MSNDQSARTQDLQHALRLGWIIAEVFGQLRRFQPPTLRRRTQRRTLGRFSYSTAHVSDTQRLAVTYRQLVELAAALQLPPPALPDIANLARATTASARSDAGLTQIHRTLETWSRDAAIALTGRSYLLGRALTYGGSLADTYWAMAPPSDPAFHTGRRAAKELLRSYRLHELQERMHELTEVLSRDVRDAIVQSLNRWVWDDAKARWAAAPEWSQVPQRGRGQQAASPAEQLYLNLSHQAEIWRELIFGIHQPADYVGRHVQHRTKWIARIMVAMLVLAVSVGIGLIVFACARWMLDLVWTPGMSSELERKFIEAVSAVVSLVSAVTAAVAGLFTRASAALTWLAGWIETTLIRRAIQQTTTIPWNDQT